MEKFPNCFLIATNVAIEMLGQVGVKSAIVGANVKVGARRKYQF